MKSKYLITFLIICAIGLPVYLVNQKPMCVTSEEDCPPLAHTDNERQFSIILEIYGHELSARYDNHVDVLASDILSVKLDTDDSGFTDALGNWLRSLGEERLSGLKEGYKVKICVGEDVSDDFVKKITDVLQNTGITQYTITNILD